MNGNPRLPLGSRPIGARAKPDVRAAVAAVAVGAAVGYFAANGRAQMLAIGIAFLAILTAVVLHPEAVLIAWFAAILINGRWLTYHKVGPLYVTEPLLVLVAAGVVVRSLVSNGVPHRLGRRLPMRYVLTLSGVMFVPAMLGLALHTSGFGYATGRNALLIIYVLFAVLVVAVTDLRNSYRHWFVSALGACAIALVLVVTGNAGHSNTTSTGAIRIAAYTFTLAFGIAPLLLAAAARESLIRPLWAAAASIPFVVALVFVNHRSAWIAFLAAALVVFGRRVSARVLATGFAVVAVGLVLVTVSGSRSSTLGEEIARAKTVTSTTDPNAQFRLRFWEAAMAKSIESPLIGAGFDPYPEKIVPPESGPKDPFPAPHNSFVAIGYRTGVVPLLLVLFLLTRLVVAGFRASVESDDPVDRAVCSALTSVVVYAGVTSAFNVFLEAPYAGPLFWAAVGLLAYAVLADPFGARTIDRTTSDPRRPRRDEH